MWVCKNQQIREVVAGINGLKVHINLDLHGRYVSGEITVYFKTVKNSFFSFLKLFKLSYGMELKYIYDFNREILN